MFNIGKYKFQIIENNRIILEEKFILKINALNCLEWHRKMNPRWKYRVLNTTTGEIVDSAITYKLLKGPNV